MALDLEASGPKVLAGTGGGTSGADPFIQQIIDIALEAALGAPGDTAYAGSGNGSAIALLKAILKAVGSPSTAQDGSGTVTTGGTAQNLFGGTVPANGFFVQNNSSGDLWISDIGTAAAAQPSIKIPPNGSMFSTPAAYRPAAAISLFGATTAQAFTARRW